MSDGVCLTDDVLVLNGGQQSCKYSHLPANLSQTRLQKLSYFGVEHTSSPIKLSPLLIRYSKAHSMKKMLGFQKQNEHYELKK